MVMLMFLKSVKNWRYIVDDFGASHMSCLPGHSIFFYPVVYNVLNTLSLAFEVFNIRVENWKILFSNDHILFYFSKLSSSILFMNCLFQKLDFFFPGIIYIAPSWDYILWINPRQNVLVKNWLFSWFAQLI